MHRVNAHDEKSGRADRRLLHHLTVLQRALGEPVAPARKRLDRALGPELARTVLASLDAPTARAA